MSEWEHRLRRAFRSAGRQVEQARRAYHEGRGFDLPTDEEGRTKIVCRRYAEKRAVEVDSEGRPECFDAEHPACQGCVEDIRDGVVETWR